MKTSLLALASIAIGAIFSACASSSDIGFIKNAQQKTAAKNAANALPQAQQDFVDLRFGMFIHFNIPTFANADWPDPNLPPSVFNPAKLDAAQWAKAAKSANMTYGCLTTKHHSGFCIWNTTTTDYSVKNSPFKRDVVKEYADAFRAENLKVMLYFSILDTHHNIRPGWVKKSDTDFIKAQLSELLTKYGEINAIIIDGWDAPWSRISYEQVPFEEIYLHIKSLQPQCLVLELNSAKYPQEALLYTDVKSYEQNAGQHVSRDKNILPAMSCLPINDHWFWKRNFPNRPVKSPETLVNDNLVPLNDAHCNFILNVAPNTDGLIDANATAALAEIGKLWKNNGAMTPLTKNDAPIVASNLAKFQRANSSWSWDTQISDFANDDDFGSCWITHPSVKQPWIEIIFDTPTPLNTALFMEKEPGEIQRYTLEYFSDGKWHPLAKGNSPKRLQIHRFDKIIAEKVRLNLLECKNDTGIREFCLYNEIR